MSTVWETVPNKNSRQKNSDAAAGAAGDSEVVPVQCSRCRRTGHLARDCEVRSFLKPVAAPAASSVLICFRCSLPGHRARDCKIRPPASKPKPDDSCSTVSTAASTQPAQDAPLLCFRCGKPGHVQGNCTLKVTPCLNCGEQDHPTGQCTNTACFECHEKGHKLSACPQRAARLAREHQEYLERKAHREAVALERRQRAGQKMSTDRSVCLVPAAVERADSPPTPETRQAPEIRSCELFPPLGGKKPAAQPSTEKHTDLDQMD